MYSISLPPLSCAAMFKINFYANRINRKLSKKQFREVIKCKHPLTHRIATPAGLTSCSNSTNS
nr:MAG TPA: Protein of unknown function (DUF3175) [Caudoviricetes sp.]